MLKKLRNKMLLMNMISTFCLIAVSFAAIFSITYNNVQKDIDESLFRAFTFHRPMPRPSEADKPPRREGAGKQPSEGAERVLRDIRSFSVYVGEDNNIVTNSMFGENSEHYESVVKEVLSQNNVSGEFKSEDIVWCFETHMLENGDKIIAIADITAEKNFLVNLIVSFLICAAVLLVLIFVISLYFANKAIAPVKEAWEKQKQFVADASHELKTPLTAINANIDVLLTNAAKADVKWLGYVKNEVERLKGLTENLLMMAKVDNEAAVEMKMESFSDIVRQTVLNFEAVAFEKGVRLECNIQNDICVFCNKELMIRLCSILFDNAVKYSPKGEKVLVALEKDSHIQMRIHNRGEAIPPQEQMKIFDRFYRGDKSRSTDGYGLGLSIAKEIVNMHKGKITVRSFEESGTEFVVVFAE